MVPLLRRKLHWTAEIYCSQNATHSMRFYSHGRWSFSITQHAGIIMVLLVRYFFSFFFVLFCLLFKLTNIHSGNSNKLKIDDFKTSNQPTFLALMNTKTLQRKKKCPSMDFSGTWKLHNHSTMHLRKYFRA